MSLSMKYRKFKRKFKREVASNGEVIVYLLVIIVAILSALFITRITRM